MNNSTIHNADICAESSSCEAGFIEPEDSRWSKLLHSVEHDIFHLPNFSKLESLNSPNHRALAFWGKCDQTEILIPLTERPIPADTTSGEELFDVCSPYGYPSPLLKEAHDQEKIKILLGEFQRQALKLNYVSAFLRLHPLLGHSLLDFNGIGETVDLGETVYSDLALSEEELTAHIRRDHRAGIRKLKEQGYRTIINDWNYLPQFLKIYRETMKRVSAKDFYFFSDRYFEALRDQFQNRFMLVSTLSPTGEIASASLFSTCCGIVQYFLSGTSVDHFKSAPVKLLLHDVIIWAKQQRLKYLHFGGGVGASKDSLFKFKEGFSKSTAKFGCVNIIFDKEKYELLCSRNKSQGSNQSEPYFPAYRG